MNKFILIALFLLKSSWLSAQIYTQSNLPYPSTACINSSYTVTVYPTNVPAGQTLSVRLSNDNFSTSSQIGSAVYNGTDYSVSVACTIPLTASYGTTYQVRAETAGATAYASSNFTIVTATPGVSFSSNAYSYPACDGYTSIPVNFTGYGPYIVTLQKNSETPYDYYYYNNPDQISISAPGTYTLLGVSNACGAGTVASSPNNSAVVTATPPNLTIGTLPDDMVCMGNQLLIPFTSSQSCYNYQIQLSDNTGNNFTTIYTTTNYSFPNTLVATIPDNGQPEGGGYKLRVAVTVGGIEYHSAASATTLSLWRKPTMAINQFVNPIDVNYPTIIAKGESLKVRFDLTGQSPWQTVVNNESITITSSPFEMDFSPTVPTNYIFSSLTDATGCVNNNVPEVAIEVKDLIFKHRVNTSGSLDIYSYWRNYCKGQYMGIEYNVRGIMPVDSFKVQYAFVDDLSHDDTWTNMDFAITGNDDKLEAYIPTNIKTGRNRIRFVPTNPNLTYQETPYTIINDYLTPSSDFVVMDRVSGYMPGDSLIKIAPNEPFSIFYEFSGGPDYYKNSFGSVKVYKPTLLTSTNQTINYNDLSIGGFNDVKGRTNVDTVTKSITYKLVRVQASSALGDVSCQDDFRYTVMDSLRVQVIPNDPSRSITTNAISGATGLCGGSSLTIPFSSTGTFNGGNTFKVQLMEFTNLLANVPKSNFYDATVLSFTSNSVTIKLPEKASENQTFYFKARVVSTNPYLIGSTSPTVIEMNTTKPFVELTGDAYVQAGENATVKIKVSSYPYFTFTITDGSWDSPVLNSSSYGSTFQPYTFATQPSATAGSTLNFTAENASNTCGSGIYKGVGKVHIVSSPSITLTPPVVTTYCWPIIVNIPFNSSLTFKEDNIFTAKVYNTTYGYEYVVSGVEAKLKGNSFEIKIPPQSAGTYYIKIYSSSPYAYSNSVSINLINSPSASVNPTMAEIEYGQSVLMNYSINGTPNFSFTLDYGNYTANSSSAGNSTHTVFPSYSKVYRLTNLVDGNGCKSSYTPASTTVTVYEKKQSLEILTVSKTTLCSGSNVAVNFLYSGAFTSFTLQLSDANGTNFTDITTVQASNILTGTLPISMGAGTNYRIRIRGVLGGGDVFSLPNLLPLKSNSGTLSATITGSQTIVADSSINFTEDVATLQVTFTGTGPYSFNLFDGTTTQSYTTSTSPFYIRVKPTSTKTYTINSLTNACGSGTTNGSAIVNVAYIKTESITANLCQGQTFTLPFTPTGTFEPSNQWFIEMRYFVPYDNSYSYESNLYRLAATRVGNTLQAVIPNTLPATYGFGGTPIPSVYQVRASSSNPAIKGTWAIGEINVNETNTTVSILGSTNILSGQEAIMTITSTKIAGGYLTISNGISSENLAISGLSMIYNKSPLTTTTYTITSVTPACGIGTIGTPSSATITVGPCPPSQTVTLTHTFGQSKKYETSGQLTASNKIQSGANILYDAQQSVLLLPGFEASQGAIFKAYIDGCGGQ